MGCGNKAGEVGRVQVTESFAGHIEAFGLFPHRSWKITEICDDSEEDIDSFEFKSLLAAAVERIVVGLERGKDFLRAMREGTGNEDLDRDNGGERRREVDRPKSPQRW